MLLPSTVLINYGGRCSKLHLEGNRQEAKASFLHRGKALPLPEPLTQSSQLKLLLHWWFSRALRCLPRRHRQLPDARHLKVAAPVASSSSSLSPCPLSLVGG